MNGMRVDGDHFCNVIGSVLHSSMPYHKDDYITRNTLSYHQELQVTT